MTRDECAFADLIEQAEQYGPITMSVAHPCSPESLMGAVESAEHGLITPHAGGDSTSMLPRMAALIRRQIEHLRAGESPETIVLGG